MFLVDFFDDEKIKLIEALPDPDAIITIWFKLLALAGKSNCGGFLLLEKRLPLTEEMLSTIFGRPLNTVRLALRTFETFEMISLTEEKVIQVQNWEKFQSLDSDGAYKEAARKRMAEYRAKKVISIVTQPLRNVTPLKGEREGEKKQDSVEIEKNSIIAPPPLKNPDFPDLPYLWKNYCPSLP
jgi:predicted phage replisome organizer